MQNTTKHDYKTPTIIKSQKTWHIANIHCQNSKGRPLYKSTQHNHKERQSSY